MEENKQEITLGKVGKIAIAVLELGCVVLLIVGCKWIWAYCNTMLPWVLFLIVMTISLAIFFPIIIIKLKKVWHQRKFGKAVIISIILLGVVVAVVALVSVLGKDLYDYYKDPYEEFFESRINPVFEKYGINDCKYIDYSANDALYLQSRSFNNLSNKKSFNLWWMQLLFVVRGVS